MVLKQHTFVKKKKNKEWKKKSIPREYIYTSESYIIHYNTSIQHLCLFAFGK